MDAFIDLDIDLHKLQQAQDGNSSIYGENTYITPEQNIQQFAARNPWNESLHPFEYLYWDAPDSPQNEDEKPTILFTDPPDQVVTTGPRGGNDFGGSVTVDSSGVGNDGTIDPNATTVVQRTADGSDDGDNDDPEEETESGYEFNGQYYDTQEEALAAREQYILDNGIIEDNSVPMPNLYDPNNPSVPITNHFFDPIPSSTTRTLPDGTTITISGPLRPAP